MTLGKQRVDENWLLSWEYRELLDMGSLTDSQSIS